MKISTEDECGGSQQHVGPKVSSPTFEVLVKIDLVCFPPSIQLPSLVLKFVHLGAAQLLPW